MVLKDKDFRLYLTSRVQGENNQPGEFTTKFPTPIELQGSEWEVGVEALHYLHSWFDFYKDMSVGILIGKLNDPVIPRDPALDLVREYTLETLPANDSAHTPEVKTAIERGDLKWISGLSPKRLPLLDYNWHYAYNRENLLRWINEDADQKLTRLCRTEKDTIAATPFHESILKYRKQHRLWNFVFRTVTIPKGNFHGPEHLCKVFHDKLCLTLSDITNDIDFNFNAVTKKVEIRSKTHQIYLITEWGYSLLHILGLTTPAQVPNKETPVPLDVYFLPRHLFRMTSGKREISPKVFCGMYIYTDIIDFVNVGDTLAPCLAYVPIDSKFNELGHYYSSPAKYHKVKATNFNSIEISMRLHTGERIPMEDGETLIILHFHRCYKLGS